MAHTFDNKVKIPVTVNTSTNATTATGTFACGANATLLTLGLIYAGGSNRTGGAPTYGSITGTQADTARRAATSPEASTELWYWLDPTRSTTLLISIPNAGGLALEGFVGMIGAFLGWKPALMTIMVGSFLGSIVGIALIAAHVIKREDYIPFGPFLVCGALLSMFFGQPLLDWYQGLLAG